MFEVVRSQSRCGMMDCGSLIGVLLDTIRYYSVLSNMSTPYARISITLPAEDLAAADRLAAQQDRSRSWIVAEAIRRYAR